MSKRLANAVDLTLEKAIQADVIELYERMGCLVKPTQQSYRRGSRRNPGAIGIPDLYVFPPTSKGVYTYGNSFCDLWPWWHETKSPSGTQSDMQAWWQYECEQRGVGYVLGGTEAALERLRKIGLIVGGTR